MKMYKTYHDKCLVPVTFKTLLHRFLYWIIYIPIEYRHKHKYLLSTLLR